MTRLDRGPGSLPGKVQRRRFLELTALSAVGLSTAVMAGCGSGSSDGKLTLRYGGWGNSVRQRNYAKAVKQFMPLTPMWSSSRSSRSTARFRLRAAPVAPGAGTGHKFLYFPRMAIYQGIDQDKVEAAGTMLDYNTNNIQMVKTVGLTMGAPVNPKIAKQAGSFAGPNEKEMLAVVQQDRDAERKPRYEAPAGSSTWREAMTRITEQIALGKTSVPSGAKALMDDIKAGIERAL